MEPTVSKRRHRRCDTTRALLRRSTQEIMDPQITALSKLSSGELAGMFALRYVYENKQRDCERHKRSRQNIVHTPSPLPHSSSFSPEHTPIASPLQQLCR